MNYIKVTPPRDSISQKLYPDKHLKNCLPVFARNEKSSHPLEQPYSGPHQGLKYFVLNMLSREDSVSEDRIKAASFLLNNESLTDEHDDIPLLNEEKSLKPLETDYHSTTSDKKLPVL